ncbi:MAG: response regulator [Thioalkalispiraceae bacterium]|jgi:CheY-like chemotaxis protein
MLDKVVKIKQLSGRVLLVEDNPVNLMVLEGMLEKLGLVTEAAKNGEEGISMWAQKNYDAIIMDIQMPQMGGLEATQQIRAREAEGMHQVIIALTANVFAEDEQACKEAGMDAYMTKPINLEVLYSTLKDYLPEA